MKAFPLLGLLLASASGVGCSNSASHTTASSSTTALCPILKECCVYGTYFYGSVQPPPSCDQIAASQDEALCELTLLAMNEETTSLHLDLGCGSAPAEGSPIPPQSNPACEALSTCGTTLPNAGDALAAGLIQGLHFAGPCAVTLSYLKSAGYCSAVSFDAGVWSGLPPVSFEGGYASSGSERTSISKRRSASEMGVAPAVTSQSAT